VPYPEAINLPFNFSSIKDGFELMPHPQNVPADEGIWVIIQGNNVIVVHEGDRYSLPQGKPPEWLPPGTQPALCIGMWHGRPVRAVAISSTIALQPPFISEPFNASQDRLDIQTLTISGLAKQILHWENHSRHCQRCGSDVTNIIGSWGKRCSSCSAEHFPHIHPCAIVLVKRGNELLLTRKQEWAPGRYGLVAGFLDFGESLEECAIREVKEETGIDICNVRYVGSQNWPFPAQLMAGFVADYAGGEICIESHELEDARWFKADELPSLPPPRSIARWILDTSR
jgi:NAD+ diphosphatase